MYKKESIQPLLDDQLVDDQESNNNSPLSIIHTPRKTQDNDSDSVYSPSYMLTETPKALSYIVKNSTIKDDEINEMFDQPFYKKNIKFQFKIFLSYFRDSSFLTLTLSVNLVTIILIYFNMRKENDSYLLASFGLGISYFQFTFATLNDSLFEVTGLQCCKAFAEKKYKRLNTILMQSFTLQIILCSIITVQFYFSETILRETGIHERHANQAGIMLKWQIPGMILQCFVDQLKSYLTIQDLISFLGWLTLFNIVMNFFLVYFFVVVYQMPLYAFPIIKVINELLVLYVCMLLWLFSVKKEYKEKPCWKTYRKNMCSHIAISLKVIMGYYSESFGFLITTHQIGITQNNTEITAFTQWITIVQFQSIFGDGFGFINRINVANLLVKEKPKNAKYLAFYYLFLLQLVGITSSICLLTLNIYIVNLYTHIKTISELLKNLIFMYGLFCFTEIINSSLNAIMRLQNKIAILDGFQFIYLVVQHPSLGYIMCFVQNWKAKGLIIAYAISTICQNITTFSIISSTNWENIIIQENTQKSEDNNFTWEDDEKLILSEKNCEYLNLGYGESLRLENIHSKDNSNDKNRYR